MRIIKKIANDELVRYIKLNGDNIKTKLRRYWWIVKNIIKLNEPYFKGNR